MPLNLPNKILECLQQNPEQKFTAREIAAWILKTYPDECREKQKRSKAKVIPLDNQKAFLNQIAAEMSSRIQQLQKRQPEVKTTEDRPRKYYFTKVSDEDEVANIERESAALASKNNNGAEHSLYPVLSEFLWQEYQIYSKRIDEKRSRNTRGSGGNKWLYPDVVALEDLSRDWNREIKDCVQQYADKKTKLWSFEVKILLNRSNVREAFFQAVSNSSWANLGYLVASEISGEALKELRMLSSLHGIGMIHLNAKNPEKSQLILPAKERNEIDWDTANRLAEENRDFQDYIKLIRQFYQTGEIRRYDWDGCGD